MDHPADPCDFLCIHYFLRQAHAKEGQRDRHRIDARSPRLFRRRCVPMGTACQRCTRRCVRFTCHPHLDLVAKRWCVPRSRSACRRTHGVHSSRRCFHLDARADLLARISPWRSSLHAFLCFTDIVLGRHAQHGRCRKHDPTHLGLGNHGLVLFPSHRSLVGRRRK